MSEAGLYRYLHYLVMDDELRAAASVDVLASMHGFDLSHVEQEWLKSRMVFSFSPTKASADLTHEPAAGMSAYFRSVPDALRVLNLFDLGAGNLPGMIQAFEVRPITVIPDPPITITTITVAPTPTPTPTPTPPPGGGNGGGDGGGDDGGGDDGGGPMPRPHFVVVPLSLRAHLAKEGQDVFTAIASSVKDVKTSAPEDRLEKLIVLAALLEII